MKRLHRVWTNLLFIPGVIFLGLFFLCHLAAHGSLKKTQELADWMV